VGLEIFPPVVRLDGLYMLLDVKRWQGLTGFFIFDVPRDKDGEPIEDTPEKIIRCPYCQTGRTQYHNDLQEYICVECAHDIKSDYNQTYSSSI
jgi:DNA-directed RNA polymerase subunit RPC12/RpoP